MPPISAPALEPVARSEPSVASAESNRLILRCVSWEEYGKFLEAVCERRVRVTYDRGTIEIMTLSRLHEWWKNRLGLILVYLCLELKIPMSGYGSTTHRREDLQRGLEPDECYYIQHADQVRGPREIDLTRDPPPDLCLEIEISRSSLDRLGIYAALRIPEVWRFDGERFRVHLLSAEGTYEQGEQSRAFPGVPLASLAEFLHETQELNDLELQEPFRAWLRQHALPPLEKNDNGA